MGGVTLVIGVFIIVVAALVAAICHANNKASKEIWGMNREHEEANKVVDELLAMYKSGEYGREQMRREVDAKVGSWMNMLKDDWAKLAYVVWHLGGVLSPVSPQATWIED